MLSGQKPNLPMWQPTREKAITGMEIFPEGQGVQVQHWAPPDLGLNTVNMSPHNV